MPQWTFFRPAFTLLCTLLGCVFSVCILRFVSHLSKKMLSFSHTFIISPIKSPSLSLFRSHFLAAVISRGLFVRRHIHTDLMQRSMWHSIYLDLVLIPICLFACFFFCLVLLYLQHRPPYLKLSLDCFIGRKARSNSSIYAQCCHGGKE